LLERSRGVAARKDTNTAYKIYAPVYDRVFAPSFAEGHTRMVEALDAQQGERVLEVGVGTGISLRHYVAGVRVDALDFSAAMLKKARKRIDKGEVAAEVTLHQMDAHKLEFDDGTFDHAVVAHAIAVVAEPEVVLREMMRVTRPGGKLVVVNHYKDEPGKLWRAWNPVRRKLGLGEHFDLPELLEACGLEIVSDDIVNRIKSRLIVTRLPT
jgi:phosphatidylethanolamine/phosphatidyl-N-methylethanolamine N-methyltransferase|tara:strand:+ start:3359 stop:3991 length:633 start_codon:yes stop_codon:yes gene_type:complete